MWCRSDDIRNGNVHIYSSDSIATETSEHGCGLKKTKKKQNKIKPGPMENKQHELVSSIFPKDNMIKALCFTQTDNTRDAVIGFCP